MVKYSQAALDAVFRALADATRRAILARLARGEARVTELAAPFRMSLPAVAKHLHVLAEAGLVTTEKDGRVRRCRMEPRPLAGAAEWIEFHRHFWQEQLDSLARYFEDLNENEKEEPCHPPQPKPSTPSRSAAPSRRRRRRPSTRGSSRNA